MTRQQEKGQLSNIGSKFPRGELIYLLGSFSLQLILGLFFGHMYDMRINMATGYLVATGQNPYIPTDLTGVFHNPAFQNMTSVGYPPPWPLLLGMIYLLSYAWMHNFLIYNLAIKLPIILANFGLAYLVRDILREHHADQAVARKAWIFLLFNPFLLYATTAWGQFDSLVALLTIGALVLLDRQKWMASSTLLALAISLKPTPIPVVLAVVIYLWGSAGKKLIGYLLILGLGLLVFSVLPFILFDWDINPILHGWNAQFSMSGGMALTTLYELVSATYVLPGKWWLLGFLWLPAILITTIFLKRGNHGLLDLLHNSLILILVFFLTRTWLSEQNLVLLLPIILLLVWWGELPRISLSAIWILPLVFTIFNTSPAQLLFPSSPELMTRLLQWADLHSTIRAVTRMLVVVLWQVAGWWMVFHKPGKKRVVAV